ncbi:prephenate dehydrogenase [Microcella sp.]|uniref:prephenate dehydrogenase n=1 Tax=Microcella sp. TaxID=1913979 RepID=UPI003F71C6EE
MSDRRLQEQVHIIGAGLLGTSIGLALSEKGVDVTLADQSPTAVRLAVDYGAGRAPRADDRPGLVVVAVPPDVTAATVARALTEHPEALVTDGASVKGSVLTELRALGADVSRYLGTHPLAGRERGGPISARADLFLGRPWVLAGHDGISYRRAGAIEDLILDVGAVPIEMSVDEHDRSVAMVSHVPQLVASAMAARLRTASNGAVGLAGQGVRDVTRIASSDPGLWVQILSANAAPVAEILRGVRDDVDALLAALADPEAPGSRRALAELIAAGNAGVARIPGKHGDDRRFAQLVVMIDDTPGQLARLLTEIGELDINMEDLRLEHSPGAPIGFAEVSVLPDVEQRLIDELSARGWRIAGAS